MNPITKLIMLIKYKIMANENLVPYLLGIKIILLIGFAIGYERLIVVGEKSLQAQDTPQKRLTAREKMNDLLNLPELDTKPVKKAELSRYLNIAEQKKQQIEERLNFLQKREQQLASLEQLIEEKLVKLDEERLYFSQTLQREKNLKGERQDQLVKFYEKMDPKKAAPIFEKLDRDLVVTLFRGMKQTQVTNILQNMDPEKSTELSEYYGRVRSTREYEILKEINKKLVDAFADCRNDS